MGRSKIDMSKPSVKKNFIYSTFYQVLSIITPLITAPYVSRVLGASNIGIQSYTSSIQSYFTLVAILGTASYGAREVSRARDNKSEYSKLFWEIEFLSIGTSLVTLLAWIGLCVFSAKYRIYYIVMIPNILSTMFDISWLYNGLEKFKLTVIRNTIFKLIGVAVVFIVVRSQNDLLLYIAVSAITGLLSSLSLWTYLPKIVEKPHWKQLQIGRHFKQTFMYFIPTIASSIYLQLDKTMIGLITKDEAQNGYYAQADKILSMVKAVSFQSISAVIGVRISYLFKEEKYDEIHQRIEKSLNYIFFISIGAMFGIIGTAKNFVPLFFGSGYEPVITLLYIFSPLAAIIGVSNCLGSHYYTPVGKRVESSKYIIAGAVVNLCFNSLLIPFYGANGAAIGTLIAETTISVLYAKHSCGYFSTKLLLHTAGKKIIAGVVMAAYVIVLGMLEFPAFLKLVLQVSTGAAVYTLLLLLMRDAWITETVKGFLHKIKARRN